MPCWRRSGCARSRLSTGGRRRSTRRPSRTPAEASEGAHAPTSGRYDLRHLRCGPHRSAPPAARASLPAGCAVVDEGDQRRANLGETCVSGSGEPRLPTIQHNTNRRPEGRHARRQFGRAIDHDQDLGWRDSAVSGRVDHVEQTSEASFIVGTDDHGDVQRITRRPRRADHGRGFRGSGHRRCDGDDASCGTAEPTSLNSILLRPSTRPPSSRPSGSGRRPARSGIPYCPRRREILRGLRGSRWRTARRGWKGPNRTVSAGDGPGASREQSVLPWPEGCSDRRPRPGCTGRGRIRGSALLPTPAIAATPVPCRLHPSA